MFPTSLVSQIPTTGVALPAAPVVVPIQVIPNVGASSETNHGTAHQETQQQSSGGSSQNNSASFASVLANATNTQVQYNVDKDTGIVSFQVIDENTHEVIRQVPSEEVIAMARSLKQSGILLDQKA